MKNKYEGTQFRVEPTISTYYFWMNTTQPPFNNLKVRQAVNYAVDAEALERIYAGQIAPNPADPAAGDARLQEVRTLPPQHGQGRAALIKEANPTDRNITVWTDSESPNNEAGAYYQGVLKKLGFNAKLKIINADNYFAVIGNRSTPELDTGWVGLVRGLPAPQRLLPPLLSGESILPTNNDELRPDQRSRR